MVWRYLLPKKTWEWLDNKTAACGLDMGEAIVLLAKLGKMKGVKHFDFEWGELEARAWFSLADELYSEVCRGPHSPYAMLRDYVLSASCEVAR